MRNPAPNIDLFEVAIESHKRKYGTLCSADGQLHPYVRDLTEKVRRWLSEAEIQNILNQVR